MTVKDGFVARRVPDLLRLVRVLHAELSRPCGQLHPGEPGGDAGAIVPEWYFLPFYAILRAIPDKLGGVIAMFGSIVVLALRALARHLAGALGGVPADLQAVLLGLRGRLRPARLARREAAGGRLRDRGAGSRTAYYFVHFLVHPAAARLLRAAAAAAGLDRSTAVLGARKRGSRHAGRRRCRAAIQGLMRALETEIMIKRTLLIAAAAARPRGAGARRRRDARCRRSSSGASTGPFGTFDRAQLQRGFKVYREVCPACHGLELRRLPQPRGARRPGILRGAGPGARRRVQDQGRAERCRRHVRARRAGRPTASRGPSRTSRRPPPPMAARRRPICR